MKRINAFFLFLFVATSLFISCEKQLLEPEKQNDVFIVSDLLVEITEGFNENNAVFKDVETLITYYNEFSKLNGAQRNDFLSSLEFEPLSIYKDRIQDGLANLETREDYVSYLEKYGNILSVQIHLDDTESVIDLNQSTHFASTFANKDRIIQIGDTYFKYWKNYAIISSNYFELLRLNTLEDIKSSGLSFEVVVESMQNVISRDNFDVLYYEEITNNNSGCKNDRRIKFYLEMQKQTVTLNGITSTEGFMWAEVVAWRKGIPCIWYTYNTTITWNDCDLQGDFYDNGTLDTHITFQPSDETKNSVKRIDRSQLMWGKVIIVGDATFFWTTKESSLTHQGMAGTWIYL